ncbi:chemotaxis protein CheB [Novosphingobium sp.]|uniref:chemotaxis protein CheB n=1 Tax=Novosphingobium sp. TaxID=1874826 RepID=UPI003B52326F
MYEARVLIVDDSAAMCALFSDILDRAKHVRVVGTARNAADARALIADLKPNVITLDVEMPGMNGIEFLAEIMETNPLPVVMLSSLTQPGSEMALRALELGAVECFSKPLRATPEQFARSAARLGRVVWAASNANVRHRRARGDHKPSHAHFEWNGYLAALSASVGGIDALASALAPFPAHCPATVVCLQAEPMLVEAFIAQLDAALPCHVRAAKNGAALVAGTIHIAAHPELHVVVERGAPARLRLIARDPVDGARPSADMLFGSIARGAIPAVGAVLTGMGSDGARGLRLLREAGSATFVQDRQTALVRETPDAVVAHGAAAVELPLAELGAEVLAACAMS